MKEQIIQFIKEQIAIHEQNEHCSLRAQGAYDALEDVLKFIEEQF